MLAKDSVMGALRAAREQAKRTSFTQSIELVITLKGIDPKKVEERVRMSVELPHGIPKRGRVCVFARGDLASRALEAGADRVIGKDELDSIAADKRLVRKLAREYDFFVSEGSLMPTIARHMGRFLGPRDKMPIVASPADPLDKAIEALKRTVRLRTRDQPVVQCIVGTEEMSDDEICDNIRTVVERLADSLKKRMNNIKAIYVKKTMGRAVRVAF